MDAALQAVLDRLHARMAKEQAQTRGLSAEAFGARIDEFMLPIGEEVGRLLNLLARAAGCRTLLEIGTSYGYSTLWLAEAARANGGRLISVDLSADKQVHAREALREAGLADSVELITGDAVEAIRALAAPVDFVLLDAWSDTYIPCFDALQPKLADGALIAADNMVEPDDPDARAYQAHVRRAPGWQSLLLTTGNGIELSRLLPAREAGAMDPGLQGTLMRLHERMAEEERLRETLAPEAFAARRPGLMLAIGEEAGRWLHLLVPALGTRRMLEIGTSVGYSTLWLADAARQIGGRVTSVDTSADKHREARANLEQAGLAPFVELVTAAAPGGLADLPGPFDGVLIDCERADYLPCFEAVAPKLAPGGWVLADNMTFPPSPHAPAYQRHVRGLAGWDSLALPLGNGLELSRRAR